MMYYLKINVRGLKEPQSSNVIRLVIWIILFGTVNDSNLFLVDLMQFQLTEVMLLFLLSYFYKV